MTITPVAAGSATITVTASDGALTATQTIAVTVQTNQAPVKVGTLDSQTLTTGKSGTDVDVSGGFNDPDNDRLTYAATSSAVSKATVSVTGSTVTITPVAAGSATVDVTASDGAATSSKQPISVTVFDNRPPVPVGSITAQTVTAGTNTAKTVDVKSNFSDPDGDTLTYTVSSSDATKARATVLGSKVSIRGVAAGSANIIVTASDGSATTSQSISVTVTTNTAPTASGTISTKTVRVPNSVDVTVDTYFTDSDGDPLTYTASNSHPTRVGISVSGATVTITAKRADHATSSDTTMTITATDGDLNVDQTFTLTVQARSANKPVTATGSIPAQTVDVGGSASSIDVSSYFSEADGDVMRYTASSAATSKATVGVSGSTVTITPVAGGTATITVTADDGQGSSATQTIAVTVNRAPTSAGSIPAQTITAGTNARGFDVSSYFSDPDGDTLTYQATSLKTSKVTASASGSTVNLTGVAAGTASVAVTVSDGRLNFSQTFTVTVGTNRAPTAVGSIAGGNLGAGTTPKAVDVSSNFSDPDGDTLTYTASSSDGTKATASVSGSTVSITGVAAGSATITVTAGDGALTATQTIAVTVTTNRAPTTVGTLPAMTVGIGTNAVQLDVRSKFSDADGDTLTYTASSSDTTKVTVSLAGGTVNISGLALGSSTITLTASDGALSATRTFSVTAVNNRAPLKIGTMSWSPTVPDTTIVDVSAKFVDLDGDTLTYTAVSSDSSKATVSVSGSDVTMTAKRMGNTTITITASDGGLSVSHQFTVTVKKRNPNQPVTTVGSISAKNFAHGASAVSLGISSYFSEADGDAMVYTVTSSDNTIAIGSVSGTTLTITPKAAGRATLTVTADDGQDSSADQTIAVRVNRSVTASGSIPAQSLGAGKRDVTVDLSTYFSDPDTGDTITYTASSSDGAKATATVSDSNVTLSGLAVGTGITITVTASDGLTTATQTIAVTVVANQAPTLATAMPDITLRLQTHPRDIELSGYFTDPDGDTLTYTTSQSSNSQMALSVSGSTLTLTQKNTTLANTTMNITVTASDGGATTVSDTFVVTVDYNTAPRKIGGYSDWNLRVPHSLTRDLSTKFTDDDGDPLTYRVLSTTSSILGTATISGSQLTVTAERTGGVPSPAGPTNWDIHVTASDGAADATNNSRIWRIRVYRRLSNAAPQAKGTIPDANLGVGLSYTVDASQYFTEADGDVMMYGTETRTLNVIREDDVKARVSGSIVTLTGMSDGWADVTITGDDGQNTKETQTFRVSVPVSYSAPTTNGTIANQTVVMGRTPTLDVNTYFSDTDTLTYTASSSDTAKATVSVSSATLSITPVAVGTSTITVTATDTTQATATQTFTATVVANQTPTTVGTIPAQTVSVNGTTTVDVSSYFSDGNSDTLTYTVSTSDSAKATATVATSTVTISGVAVGSATITVTATDPSNATATQDISVAVNTPPAKTQIPNQRPTLITSAWTTKATVDLSSYFSDADGDTLTYTASSASTSKVTVSLSGSTVTFTAVASPGSSTITVTASDGKATTTQTFTATVNKAPTAAKTIPAQIVTVGQTGGGDTATVDVEAVRRGNIQRRRCQRYLDLHRDLLRYHPSENECVGLHGDHYRCRGGFGDSYREGKRWGRLRGADHRCYGQHRADTGGDHPEPDGVGGCQEKLRHCACRQLFQRPRWQYLDVYH